MRDDCTNKIDSPSLLRLKQRGDSGSLQPTFGFEPDGAYLAGLYPDECDGGAHFWRKPEDSPFGFTRWLPSFLGRIDGLPGKILRKLMTEGIRTNNRWRYEFMPQAPYPVLRQVAPVPKLFPPGSRGKEIKDLFFLCKQQEIPFFFHGSPVHRVTVDQGVKRITSELFPPVRFAFWHIGDLDSAGHCFGPKSPELKQAIKRIDEKISEVATLLKKRFGDVHLVIIGDHGMAEVRTHLNVEKHLQNQGINGKDAPLYFIDSTMVRFWFKNRYQRELVTAALLSLKGGRILTQEDLDRYHLNYAHNRFGDLIFLADPGVLFLPNYFQGSSPVKGMHGYAPEHPDQQSAFIINSPATKAPQPITDPVDMRRVFPTILKLLGIEKPIACRVESII